jgi:hypothetical protein
VNLLAAGFPMYASGMKSGAVWLKILALCSTVALGSGYVWWSQKKSDERRAKEAEARERMILPGSKSAFMPGDGTGPVKVDVPEAAGWKEVSRTNADSIAPSSEPKKERMMLPSSKMGLVTPSEQEKEEAPAKPRTILPGSKSIDPILSPDHKP